MILPPSPTVLKVWRPFLTSPLPDLGPEPPTPGKLPPKGWGPPRPKPYLEACVQEPPVSASGLPACLGWAGSENLGQAPLPERGLPTLQVGENGRSPRCNTLFGSVAVCVVDNSKGFGFGSDGSTGMSCSAEKTGQDCFRFRDSECLKTQLFKTLPWSLQGNFPKVSPGLSSSKAGVSARKEQKRTKETGYCHFFFGPPSPPQELY